MPDTVFDVVVHFTRWRKIEKERLLIMVVIGLRLHSPSLVHVAYSLNKQYRRFIIIPFVRSSWVKIIIIILIGMAENNSNK